jgi:hypothetical protein
MIFYAARSPAIGITESDPDAVGDDGHDCPFVRQPGGAGRGSSPTI